MTRINVVPVTELCNAHLMAEFREMPRLVHNLNQSLNRKGKPFSLTEIAPEYLLGAGHVKFFFNKFKFLHQRHQQITQELLKRGYQLTQTDSEIFTQVDSEFYGDYEPTQEAIQLNRQRILERMPKNAKWSVTAEKTRS